MKPTKHIVPFKAKEMPDTSAFYAPYIPLQTIHINIHIKWQKIRAWIPTKVTSGKWVWLSPYYICYNNGQQMSKYTRNEYIQLKLERMYDEDS
jgi:hypothetical protein